MQSSALLTQCVQLYMLEYTCGGLLVHLGRLKGASPVAAGRWAPLPLDGQEGSSGLRLESGTARPAEV
eukprot:6203919-Pleurochrysis_carterae.AAC.1